MQKFEKAFVSSRAGISVVDFLADELPLSKGKLKEAMQKGAVWLKRGEAEPERVRRAKEMVKLRDEIHIYYDEDFLDINLPPLRCVEQNDTFSIWIKPEGILNEVNLYGDHLSLERLIERDVPKELDCYFVDPADGEITGLMVIAHGEAFAEHLETQLERGDIVKDYRLTVRGQAGDDMCLEVAGARYPVRLVKYNSYNNTSQIRLEKAQGIELHIMALLQEKGLVPLEAEQLQCCSLSFPHPKTGRLFSFSL